MQLKAVISTLSTSGLLPVVIGALLLSFVLGALGGGYVGWKWRAGKQAIAENKQLTQDAVDAKAEAVQQATSTAAAGQRQQVIAQAREQDRETLSNEAEQLSSAVETLRIAQPDLGTIDLGSDFLRHWNQANGHTTTPTAARAAGQPDATVPGAAGSDQRDRAGDPAPARSGSAAVSRLPQPSGATDRGDERVSSHGMAVVLPHARAAATERGGLQR